jgi:apolipoprotein N-acyltransferase
MLVTPTPVRDEARSVSPVTPRSTDPSPQAIIAAARTAAAPMTGPLLAACVSSVLLWAAFPPVEWGPLAWVALFPVLCLARLEQTPRRMYLAVYLGSFAFWVASLQWMRLGDPTMYPAWIALSAYLAAYLPICLGLTRVAVRRWNWPIGLAAPLVWVGLECVRGYALTGFGWYLLSHTQYLWIDFIQLADTIGTYGLSGLVLLPAAVAADMVPMTWLAAWGWLPVSESSRVEFLKAADQSKTASWYVRRMGLVAGVLMAVVGYGMWRRSTGEFLPGPRVALIQGNEPAVVNPDPRDWPKQHQRHMQLTGQAVREQPDLIVWPEGMFRWPALDSPPGVSDEDLTKKHPHASVEHLRQLDVPKRLGDISRMAGAALVMGQTTVSVDLERLRYYNSATFVTPETGMAGRYDKIHRVVFGEYVPLVDWLPFLAGFTPYADATGLSAGTSGKTFEHKSVRYSPVICYEDTVPHLVRRVVRDTTDPARGAPDVLLNLSNDGWFHGSSEHDQHLITSVFRCIETRTPLARAANMGVSAIIDGDGVIRVKARDLETGASKGCEAVVVGQVPLDPRGSAYLLLGDMPAACCSTLCGMLLLVGMRRRTV